MDVEVSPQPDNWTEKFDIAKGLDILQGYTDTEVMDDLENCCFNLSSPHGVYVLRESRDKYETILIEKICTIKLETDYRQHCTQGYQ